MKLKDKTFIIFGASSGIGDGLARKLSVQNRVGTFSRRPMKSLGENHLHIQGDVTQLSNIKDAYSVYKDKWEGVDGFIFSAGVAKKTDFQRFNSQDVKSTMDTNFFGFTNCLEVFLPEFQKRSKGLIAMISALSVSRSLPQGAAYFASKAAQHVFFEGLRLDLQSTGIKFSEIRPGLVDTPMAQSVNVDAKSMWSVEKAATHILRRLEKGESDISFPLDLKLLSQTARFLPDAAYFKIVRSQMKRALKE